MKARRQELMELQEQIRHRGKKFVGLQEGAEYYSLGLHTFRDLAEDAGAVYHVKRRVLVNTEIFEEFMEMFHDMPEEEGGAL